MSWHYSQALEVEFSEASFSGGNVFARLNSMSTQGNASLHARTTEVLIHSQSGMTSEHSMENSLLDWWMSYLADSHARTYQPQEGQIEKASQERGVGCGLKWPESFAKYDHHLCLWRTHQRWLFGGWELCSGIWPRWGMMLDGECFRLPTLEHDTSVRGCGLLPVIGTPLKSQRSRSPDFTSPAKNPFELCPRGFLPHPGWVENLMGWPVGWTDLSALETGKFRKWLNLHGKSYQQATNMNQNKKSTEL